MRFSLVSIGLLALLTPLTAAWSKEDREIFRVRDEIRTQEGTDKTFYDILEIQPNASQDEITKAYRKKTRSLHPDKVRQNLISQRKADSKNKGSKPGAKVKPPSESEIRTAQRQASERQTRLSLIANILRGPERARYDHFLSNGFPTWKGTNYYYSRYRPGLGTVLVGLFLVGGGGFHYLALYMSWKRRREFLERYIKFARQTAWGENLGIPAGAATAAARQPANTDSDADADEESYQPKNRRERRLQERENRREQGKKAPKKKTPAASQAEQSESGPTGTRKRVVAENGKILVVDSLGDVYLEEEDEDGNVELFLLDPNELRKPRITDTAVIQIPLFAVKMATLRATGARPQPIAVDDDEEEAEDDDSEPAQPTPSSSSDVGDFEMLEKSTDSLEKAKATGAQAQASGKKRRNKKR
ncbi:hypothetical protein jhhlp_007232 [Lomentospora prolificans]|uniref:J domain-containing protein n=1 Tax=Lomentospora prolificans TaxID=41688 RepID=A0A2N3N233_9PEZI|nr:hypothetical protein jhhlp_007232 [Lomentospora prolificans]